MINPDQEYEILEGLRRAKAAQEEGHTTVRGYISDGGRYSPIVDLPIDKLHCPSKDFIDLSGEGWRRWMKIKIGMERGDIFPPIIVVPGSRGKLVKDIETR